VKPETMVMLITGQELMGVEKIREALFNAGFKVAAVETGNARQAVLEKRPALIVANLSGSEAADLELCWLLRRLVPAPIVVIGAGQDEALRIGMLEMVVDDFLTRPVNPRELVARVRSILRRTQHALPGDANDPAHVVHTPQSSTAGKPGFLKNIYYGVRSRIDVPWHGQG
jgi:DNA-binding response OmpR family regulator